jgi:hypothetical protein
MKEESTVRKKINISGKEKKWNNERRNDRHKEATVNWERSRGQLKCDGTRAETRFRLSAKRTSPFKSAGASVQSTADSRGVRISGSNAGYTVFRGSVKSTGYPFHSPVSPSLPFPCVTVCHHHISTGVYHVRWYYTGAGTKNEKSEGRTRLNSSRGNLEEE